MAIGVSRGVELRAYSFQGAPPEGSRLGLARHPKLRDLLNATGSLKGDPESISRGIGIGLFIGLTPTVGFQTAMMITTCILLAGNFPVAFATSFVSNPFTMAPIYWGFHELGEAVFKVFPFLYSHDHGGILWSMVNDIIFTGLGSLMIATPVSVCAYLFTRSVLNSLVVRRNHRRNAHRVE